MRLTAKLSAAVGLCIFLVLAGNAFLRAQADVDRFEVDVARDHRVMGRAIAETVEHLGMREGPARARELVETLNHRDALIDIIWLENAVPGPAPTTAVETREGERYLVTLVPVETAPRHSTLRLSEALRAEDALIVEAYGRAARTAALLAALSTLVMMVLGAVLIGRPLVALGQLARRVGAGDLEARASLRSARFGGDEIGVLASEMNRMTEALARTQARLDEELAARVGILEQLRHADRLRVVGEISSEVAHQIGTPLAAARARAQLLAQSEVPTDRVTDTANSIVSDVDRVSNIVRRLLDFARRRSGPRTRVDAAQWADATLDILRPLTGKRRVALELRKPEAGVDVVIDELEMQQALTNLVMNALAASPEGSIIEVALAAEPSMLRIDVVDQGTGIAPDALQHVFEPYFTTKQAGEGTGLGLSVAHGIVREHGGTIDLESTLGEGTRVTVRVPREPPTTRSDGKASWTARPRPNA